MVKIFEYRQNRGSKMLIFIRARICGSVYHKEGLLCYYLCLLYYLKRFSHILTNSLHFSKNTWQDYTKKCMFAMSKETSSCHFTSGAKDRLTRDGLGGKHKYLYHAKRGLLLAPNERTKVCLKCSLKWRLSSIKRVNKFPLLKGHEVQRYGRT